MILFYRTKLNDNIGRWKKIHTLWSNIWAGIFLIFVAALAKKFLYPEFCENFKTALHFAVAVTILVGGLAIVGGCLKYKSWIESKKNPKQSERVQPDNEKNGNLRMEYKLSQEMHNYYGRLTWQIGTIFLGGGVTGLGVAIQAGRPVIVFAAVVFTILVGSFYLVVRRYRQLAEVHLARCREIEDTLRLRQHGYAKQATKPEGVVVPGEREPICVPLPSGWYIIQGMSLFLIVLAWIAVLAI